MTAAWGRYKASEPIRVGDVVRLDEQAFGTCIVVRIEDSPRMIHLERPHMTVDAAGYSAIMVERFRVEEDSIRRAYLVAVTGASLTMDNRCHR